MVKFKVLARAER